MIPAENSAHDDTRLDKNNNDPCIQSVTLTQVLAAMTPELELCSDKQLMAAFAQIKANTEVISIPFGQWRLDSRQVQKGDGFVLLKSQSQHSDESEQSGRSRKFAQQAGEQAAFILSEIDPISLGLKASDLSCPIVYVPDIRHILGSLIQATWQVHHRSTPDRSSSGAFTHGGDDGSRWALPKVAAVTGTNGKTTISQLLAQLCQGAGMSSAVMGTAGNGRLSHLVQASHTTADVLAVQQFLQQMASEQVDLLSLEASSHGLDQLRLQGVPISVAIYTNLSRDHLDYHADMSEYAAAKARLFDRGYFPALTHAIINLDDDFASMMIETAETSGVTVWTYSLNPQSDDGAEDKNATATARFVARQIEPSLEGARVEIDSPMGRFWVDSPLLGRFNVANLLAAVAAAIALGVDVAHIPELVSGLRGANGRMQRINNGEPKEDASTPSNKESSATGCFIVDYAHTPDALTQVLSSLRPHCSGQLWAVFGCGGDRDKGKRPLMAQAGLAQADQVILTSDNPRSEDPLAILQDMQVGMTQEQRQRIHVEPDRRQAIYYAVAQAAPEDIVVIAGKGHETYQEIKGVRHDFDDTVVVRQALQRQH